MQNILLKNVLKLLSLSLFNLSGLTLTVQIVFRNLV